jgi:plasmid replication initiation protein
MRVKNRVLLSMDTSLMNAKVVKSNAMIEASYRLSTQEQRILLCAISQIKQGEEVTDQIMYSISVQDISELTGIVPDSLYKEIEDAALKLKRREIRIPDEPNGKGKKPKVLITSWLQAIQYVPNSGTLQIRFSHDILPYITQLKEQFTIYKLKDIALLTSSYAIRLYELLIQWNSVGTRTVELAWLKGIFLLNGKYSSIKDFKARVLEPSVEQINKTTDLWLDWGQKKTGRKVTHFVFTFGLKEEPKKKKSNKKPIKSDLKDPKFLSKHARVGEQESDVIRRLKEQFNI